MSDKQACCYVHIGAPKTGSTFLQNIFFDNRDALRANGVLYPNVSLRGFGHHDVAFLLDGSYPEWATAQDRPLEALAADLAAAAAAHAGSLLLSSENFYLFPQPARLKQLLERAGALRGRRAAIVVYLRRQDEAHESWYNQRVKAQGETGSIEESLERFHDLWDYERQLARWSSVFGEEAMVVRRYCEPGTAGTSLLEDMRSVLGLDDVLSGLPEQRVNVRENRDILSFQRRLNRLPLAPVEKRRFHKQLMALSERAKGQGLFDERPLLTVPARAALMERYASGNAAVAKRYFAGEDLFPAVADTDIAVPAASAESGLTAEKMLYILGWLLVSPR
jgi:hypothetical protein